MNSDTQLKVQAYLDNELPPGEARQIAALVNSDPEARDLYNELKDTREIVSQNEPVLALTESREFYWSKIQRDIATAERAAETRPARPWWLRLAAPLAGAAALFAVLLTISNGPRTTETTADASRTASAPVFADDYQHVVNPASSDVSTFTFRSEGMTVVWVSSQ